MKRFPGWLAGLYGVFLAIIVALCLSVAKDANGTSTPVPQRAIFIIVCEHTLGVLFVLSDGNVQVTDDFSSDALVKTLIALKKDKKIGTLNVVPYDGCPAPDLVTKSP